MSEFVVQDALIKIIKELEKCGDIVVVSPLDNHVAKKIFEAVQEVSPNLLSAHELGGIINALNAHDLGFGLDDKDFQTIMGISKEELRIASKKLKAAEW